MNPATRRQTIADLLHRSAKRYPQKTGLICGGTSWSFAEFDVVGFMGSPFLGVRSEYRSR